ncbi:phosphoribosylanthranilate isomerase [Pseudalkalibacillus sp. A8]|uniref:phosphoribosylanthranilate isomerase n=1 Tax=Pseudalkalibacillus sp. A8 TaxID=3382641 RepID=UPI0038B42D44
MPYLKICGMRGQEDYEVVEKSSADYAGFIFTDSKRYISPEEVGKWINPDSKLKHVGVFVNPTLTEIEKTLKLVQLDVIQLHGNESKSYVSEVRENFGIEIWKALTHSEVTLTHMEDYCSVVNGYVIDTKVKGKWGGTGITFDWKAIPSYVEKAEKMKKGCFIAGGIKPSNIKECLTYKPTGIDLSSGVEENERKSPRLINDLIERMDINADHLSRS